MDVIRWVFRMAPPALRTATLSTATALDGRAASVRTYAEALDDLRPPGTVTADLDANLGLVLPPAAT